MPKKRIKIPDELAAKVMFDSDRTCCVCRDSTRKVEIHHIDSDPSNNDFSNLAVVCKDCQSDAHTTHDFARNLTPELIRKYNESWRAIICARLKLSKEEGQLFEYKQQVLLEIALAPHAWKIHYMALYPGQFRHTGYSSAESGGDVWDMLTEVAIHRYSAEEWKKYLPLFDAAISNVIAQLDRLLTAHGSVIPVNIKLAVLRTNSQLEVNRSFYFMLPKIINTFGDEDTAFATQFKETIKKLSSLSRLADQERTAQEPDT